MPRLVGIAPSRSACACEEDVLERAGLGRRAGALFVIDDVERANAVLRAHYQEHHRGGPPFQPIRRPTDVVK